MKTKLAPKFYDPQLGHEADQSPPSGSKVKNAWSYTSTLKYAFIV